jgi:hypothetical protein
MTASRPPFRSFTCETRPTQGPSRRGCVEHPRPAEGLTGIHRELGIVEVFTWLRASGITSSVACPIMVEGRQWGAIAAFSTREPQPADTEERMVEFTELVATAIANTESRTVYTSAPGIGVTATVEGASISARPAPGWPPRRGLRESGGHPGACSPVTTPEPLPGPPPRSV